MWIAALAGVLLTAFVTVLVLNFTGGEQRIERKLDHRYALDDPQFRRELGTCSARQLLDGNRVENFENGTEIFPGDAGRRSAAPARHQLRDLHLLVGRHRRANSPRRSPNAREPASRSTSCSTGSAARRWTRRSWTRLEAAGVQGRALSPAALVPPRAHEQSHPPQAAGGGRRGSASPAASASPTNGTATRRIRRSLARFALPGRGPGGGPDAGGLHGQLDQDDRRGAARRGLFSRARSRRRAAAQVFTSSPSGGGDSMLLMYLLAITAAEATIDLSGVLFRAGRADAGRALATRSTAACACASSSPASTSTREVVRKASRARMGRTAGGGRAKSTSTSRRCSTARC